ncbi:MAG: cohesin domain-containing protein, partial [Pyrinomonadaceae bacterium]
GNWAPGPLRPAARPERGIDVKLPQMSVAADKEIIIPVSVERAADKGIISYEFDLRYDPSVMQPLAEPVDVAGTVSRGLTIVTNANEPGLLRVVVYGPLPIEENGTLLNLRFTAVRAGGSVSPMTFERIMFNEGETLVTVNEGIITTLHRESYH